MQKCSPFRANASDAFWFVLFCGLGMVGWDIGNLLWSSFHEPLHDLFSVGAATSSLTFFHCLIASAIVTPAYALALNPQRLSTYLHNLKVAIQNRLQRAPTDSSIPIHANLLSIPFALATFPAISIPISVRIHQAVRVSTNAAAASIVVHLAAALGAILIFFTFRGLFIALLRLVQKLRFLNPWLRRPWITALLLTLLSITAIILAIIKSRRVLAALDLHWLWAVMTVLAVGILLARLRTIPKLGLGWRRGVASATVLGLLLFAFIATFCLPYSNNARVLLISQTSWGALFDKTQTAAFDWDGDGYTSLFGANDCAPRDPSIHPGAIDIPYNGIDEDCSGEDLRYDAEPPVRRWDYPVPASLPKRPNIILLTVDALNPNHLGFNGYERPTSPNLDELAKRSVQFTNAYAQGPSTRLSLPSFFTSLYDSQIKRAIHGRIPFGLLPSNLTFAEILRDAGYRTIAVPPTTYFTDWAGIMQGFQVIDDSPTKVKGPHTSEEVSNAVIRQLERTKETETPFLLWAHYFDPHGPFDQPPGAPVFGKKNIDVYDAEIHHTDLHLGRVVDWIENNLDAQSRMLIVTADHGESFDEKHPTKHHGYDLHSSVLHIPLLVNMAGLSPRSVDGVVSLLDIAPTLVNMVKLKGKFDFEGMSLIPALTTGQGLESRVIFHTFYLPEDVRRKADPLRNVGARTSQYNLILDRQSNVFALYDFKADPIERHNLFEKEPAIASSLRSHLQLWTYRVIGGKEIPIPPGE